MTKQVSIAVGGDIFANGRFYADDGPISPTFDDVTAITGAADVFFANYEMPLSTRGQPIEKLANIRADPMIAPDIGRLGLDIVSIANNHMMDYGPEAMADTIACLGRSAGVSSRRSRPDHLPRVWACPRSGSPRPRTRWPATLPAMRSTAV